MGIKTLPRINPIQYHFTQGAKGSSPCPDIIKNDNPATVASVNAALVINLRGAEEIQKNMFNNSAKKIENCFELRHDIQPNDPLKNDSQRHIYTILRATFFTVMLSVIMLGVVILSVVAVF